MLIGNHSGIAQALARLRYALAEVKCEHALRQRAHAIGLAPAPIRPWPRARNDALEIPSLRSLKASVADLRFKLALLQLAFDEQKAGYDPNQPRVPRGEPGGGQWTDGGDSSGGSKPADVPEGDRAPVRITIHPRPRDDGGDNGDSDSDSKSPSIGEPPLIPGQEPETSRALNEFVKQAAYWLARAAIREAANPAIGTFINALEAAYWAYKVYPYIKAYLDPPKALDELQRAAKNRAKGYDLYHIVEQTAAERAGYPRRMIDGADNLVRIPALKHWEINGWFARPNKDFGGLSPREYLRDKDWAERMRVGRLALITYGVLKP